MEVDLHPLGIPLVTPLKRLSIPIGLLPHENMAGELIENGGVSRCRLEYLRTLNQGTYGVVQLLKRTGASGTQRLVCKRPTAAADKGGLLAEGVIQNVANLALIRAGIGGAVPNVYDIFMHGGECRFTMEYIDGRSALDAIFHSDNPDLAFIQCLGQICIILGVLEATIFLDHRDLKMTNIWIRRVPVTYSVGGVSLSFPFQVVILDFGFACIGDGRGATMINLGDVIPDIDPCPKNGRDLYQCIMSLWSVELVRSKLSADMQSEIKGWLEAVRGSNLRLTDTNTSLEWTYLLTSHPKFNHNPLRPDNLLMKLMERLK